MSIKGWYFTEGDRADSSYTDFTTMSYNNPVSSYTDFTANGSSYTDFTMAAKPQPVLNRSVRKAKVRSYKGSGKKSVAGKVLFCSFAVIAIILGGALFAKYYLADDTDGGNFIKNIFVQGGSNDPNNKAGANAIPLGHEDFPENTTKSKEDSNSDSGSGEHEAYAIADSILEYLKSDDDVETARAIFNWVHSNIYYQHVSGSLSYEDAAYMGFTQRSGDCYVYFSCAKMLLDRARIPNLMVKRHPVVKNGHFWNLVQLNGEWYHCDATVFKDHPDLYFMLTDDEIADKYHEFDGSLYPARASGSVYYQDYPEAGAGVVQPGDAYDFSDGPYTDYNDDAYEEDLYFEDWG